MSAAVLIVSCARASWHDSGSPPPAGSDGRGGPGNPGTPGSVEPLADAGTQPLPDASAAGCAAPYSMCGTGCCIPIALGSSHACFLHEGSLTCWGRNDEAEIATGQISSYEDRPKIVTLPEPIVELGLGWKHSCVVLANGTAWCWGENVYGQLGTGGTSSPVTSPVMVGGLTGLVRIAGGKKATCAITTAGAVKCWGYGGHGALGNGTTDSSSSPVDVKGLTSAAVRICLGYDHVCAALADGTASCWGYNGNGQIGSGQAGGSNATQAQKVPGLVDVTDVACGESYSCALTRGGSVLCWGANDFGQLGDGSTTERVAAMPVVGLTGIIHIMSGNSHTCAIRPGGDLACWGHNDSGQLGDGSGADQHTPKWIAGLAGVLAGGAGGRGSDSNEGSFTCAYLGGKSVSCWGANLDGQMAKPRSPPVILPTPIAF